MKRGIDRWLKEEKKNKSKTHNSPNKRKICNQRREAAGNANNDNDNNAKNMQREEMKEKTKQNNNRNTDE